ncbi:MAG: hypothetical protein IJT43_08250 [Stomatobaculum sp.]|nr:hypothetical protein [Stomatobaculum sp.]
MKSRKGLTKTVLPALLAGLMLGTLISSEALAGAHKWETSDTESGPGINMSQYNPPAPAEELQEDFVVVTQEAQEIDNFNGVSALCRPGGREDYDQVYNCVVLVERYYRQVYGMEIKNEYQFEIPIAEGIGPFTVTETPKSGDIGYQTVDDGGPHWFILKRVNEDGTFTVFEQNWKGVEDGVTYTMVNRRVSYENTRDLRFFRRPGA